MSEEMAYRVIRVNKDLYNEIQEIIKNRTDFPDGYSVDALVEELLTGWASRAWET
jgi:hypothetical protein